jgi:tetraacyldisaccharide 4'-kinase
MRPLLWPLVSLYRLGLAMREFQLRSGLTSVRRLKWPVVSIGNLSTGGSGKTPFVIALAKAITVRGVHVDVLSRGYGRRSSAHPLLVESDGKAEVFGDEPIEIARETGVPVYVATERYDAGLLAEADAAKERASEEANSRGGLHLLDDGFQHRQLARDVDMLLLSRRDFNDRLLPVGNLREALRAAERAHIIVIPADEPEVEQEIRSRGWQAAVWRVHRRMEVPKIEGPVVAFCGIARPEQFFAGVERAGRRIAARFAFPDHHRYTQADLDPVVAEALRLDGATAILTTEKDRVRLGALAEGLEGSIPLCTVRLHVEIENQDAAIDRLLHSLKDPV